MDHFAGSREEAIPPGSATRTEPQEICNDLSCRPERLTSSTQIRFSVHTTVRFALASRSTALDDLGAGAVVPFPVPEVRPVPDAERRTHAIVPKSDPMHRHFPPP